MGLTTFSLYPFFSVGQNICYLFREMFLVVLDPLLLALLFILACNTFRKFSFVPS